MDFLFKDLIVWQGAMVNKDYAHTTFHLHLNITIRTIEQ